MQRPANLVATPVLVVIGALVCAACTDVPGGSAGSPCNSQGICATGLVCDDQSICRDPNGGGGSVASWEAMRTPDNPTLHAVWGISATNVVAVGASGRIFRYNGNANKDFSTDGAGLTTKTLYGIWGDGAKRYWVVGSNVALTYDGSRWAEVKVWDTAGAKELTSFTLYAVHGDAKTGALYAVGQTYSSKGLVVKWDGSRWNTVTAANLAFTGRGVWVLGQQVWVVGSAQHVKNFNGTQWREQNLTENVSLTAVWSDGNKLAAVGPSKKLFQFNGSQWVDSDVRESYAANGLWGAADGTLYIVGAGKGYQEEFSSIESCVSACRANLIDEKARNRALNAIWGSGNTLFAVGASGVILRRTK